MDNYKNGKEWNALNNIWKSISQKQKEQNMDNFKIVSDFIKLHYAVDRSVSRSNKDDSLIDDYRYLDEVSLETKQLVIDLVKKGEKNLYHSIMAIIDANKGEFTTTEQLWEYYSKRFGKKRSYIFSFEPQIKELIWLCLIRMDRKGINSL